MQKLKLREFMNTGAAPLEVEVDTSSDGSFIDLIVSNGRGQIATVTLKVKKGDLVLRAESWVEPHKPGTYDAALKIEETVLVPKPGASVPLDFTGEVDASGQAWLAEYNPTWTPEEEEEVSHAS